MTTMVSAAHNCIAAAACLVTLNFTPPFEAERLNANPKLHQRGDSPLPNNNKGFGE